MSKTKTSKSVSFEKALEALETIVDQLEHGELPLEESLKHYEKGIKLARDCQLALKNAEQKVNVLMEENKQILGQMPDLNNDEE